MSETKTSPDSSILDDEALEEAYTQALTHEKAGQFELAAVCYRRTLALDAQDHAGAAVRLAAIGHGETPKSAPQAYVTTLFDQHADVFDMILVDQLHYDVPQQLRQLLDKATDEGHCFDHLLDLGCGTGLAAEALADKARQKTGVDLAENMVAIAYDKGLYDALFVGDVVQFLAEEDADMRWDLITATDVLPYMGELEQFFTLVARHLKSGGVFGFSSENGEHFQQKWTPALREKTCKNKKIEMSDETSQTKNALDAGLFSSSPYKVGPHQRFAHQTSYIESCLHQAGLHIMAAQDITVRQEQGQDVAGGLFLATFS